MSIKIFLGVGVRSDIGVVQRIEVKKGDQVEGGV